MQCFLFLKLRISMLQDGRARHSHEGVQRSSAGVGDTGAVHQDDTHLVPLSLSARSAA